MDAEDADDARPADAGVDDPREAESDLAAAEAELQSELQDDVDGGTEEVDHARAFVRSLRSDADGAVRLVGRYEGEAFETLYIREDLREAYDGDEARERVKALAMKALSDPQRDDSLSDLGHLDATIRWYEDAVVAVYPTGEWTGLVATFDSRESPLVDAAVSHLGREADAAGDDA
jgi:hypothetical protein